METLLSILSSVEIIIKMAATLLLLGLLGTIIQELIGSWRGQRSYFVDKTIKIMLEYDYDPSIYEKFIKNPLYQQHKQSKVPLRVSNAPPYLTSGNFVSILINILKPKDNFSGDIKELIEHLPAQSNLRILLQQFYEEGYTNFEDYKKRLMVWYDDITDQASGWYKKHIQFSVFYLGFAIAGIFNADTLEIYNSFLISSNNNKTAVQLKEDIENVDKRLASLNIVPDSIEILLIKEDLKRIDNSISTVNEGIGIGWQKDQLDDSLNEWLIRILGWIITAFSITLFTPLWNDLLKKLTSVKTDNSKLQTHIEKTASN